jgi:hypothetical protein
VLRDVLLTLLLPPIGVALTTSTLVSRDRRTGLPRGTLALTVGLLVLGLWLTFSAIGVLFTTQGVRTFGG